MKGRPRRNGDMQQILRIRLRPSVHSLMKGRLGRPLKCPRPTRHSSSCFDEGPSCPAETATEVALLDAGLDVPASMKGGAHARRDFEDGERYPQLSQRRSPVHAVP